MTEAIIAGDFIERRLRGRTSLGNRVYYGVAPQVTSQDGTTEADPKRLPAIVYHMQAGDYLPTRRGSVAGAMLLFLVRIVVRGNAPGSVVTALEQIKANLANEDGSPTEEQIGAYRVRCWLADISLPRPELGPGGVLYHHPGAFFRLQVTKTT